MSPRQLAARIIERSSVTAAADLVLRQTLARRRGLSATDSAWVSRAVFAYFRWYGFLDAGQSLDLRIEQALQLAAQFAADPAALTDADLLARAVPAWAAEAVSTDGAWVRAFQAEPILWLRSRPGLEARLAQELGDLVAGPLPGSFRYVGAQDLFVTPAFQEGAFELQDLASQAVGHVCAPRPGETWWDACAGEGGKTLHLSALMGGKGLLWASDRAAWRLDRLRQRTGRAQVFNYRAVAWDGGAHPPTKTRFDGILIDAPCTGSGTWGRNPHSRWTTTPKDIAELAAIQRQLLEHTVGSLKPGGRLIYSVCALTRAETTDVAAAFTAAHPELEPLPITDPFHPEAAPAPTLTLWPQDIGANGMFIAAWRKPAASPAQA
jgi:16S rRNA (cytosine967-C5)-methyltransferase